MAISPPLPLEIQNTVIIDRHYCAWGYLGKHPFLFRNVRNIDVRIQYTKCIQSEDKISGKFFLMQSV